MKTYAVFIRIIGADWVRYPFPDGRHETADLAEAFGLAVTGKTTIQETMVVRITTTLTPLPSDHHAVIRQYEIIY